MRGSSTGTGRQFGRVRAVQPFVAHSSSVRCMALGRKSAAVLATGGDDAQVNVWRVGRPAALLSLVGSTSGVSAVDFNHAETLLAAGAAGGALRVFDLAAAGKVVRNYSQAHRSHVAALDHHPFGGYVVSGSVDTTVRLWDLRRKSCMSAYKGHSSGVTCVRFSPDGSMVASGSEAGRIMIWDLTAGKLLHEFKHAGSSGGGVRGLEYHPNDFLLASTGGDRCIKFWDVDRMCLIEQTVRENAVPSCIRFTHDGSELISTSSDSVRAWRWEPSRMVAHLDAPWDAVGDMRLSSTRQNQLVVCSSADSFVSAWVVNLDGTGGNSGRVEEEEENDEAQMGREAKTEENYNSEKDKICRHPGGGSKMSDHGPPSLDPTRQQQKQQYRRQPPLSKVTRSPPRQQDRTSPPETISAYTSPSSPTNARASSPDKIPTAAKTRSTNGANSNRPLYSPPRSPVTSPRRKSSPPPIVAVADNIDPRALSSHLRPTDGPGKRGRSSTDNVRGDEGKASFDAATSMGDSFLGRQSEGKVATTTSSDSASAGGGSAMPLDLLMSALPGANYKREGRRVQHSPGRALRGASKTDPTLGPSPNKRNDNPDEQDKAIAQSARAGAAEFSKLMTDRLREMRVVGRLWTSQTAGGRQRDGGKGAAMKALRHLEKCMQNDPQLALDFVLSTPLDMGAFDLHSCVTLLPLLSTLLDHCAYGSERWCEEHALALFQAVQTLYRGFGDVIKSNAEQGAMMNKGVGGRVRTKGVDAEQRIFRATSCYESLKRLASQVERHIGRPGGVGRAASELSRLLQAL